MVVWFPALVIVILFLQCSRPESFVIKKSSVAKLGASNLEAMNNNGYNKGEVGRILVNPGTVGGFFLSPEQGDPKSIKGTEAMVLHTQEL